jgi:hypothetical protein
MDFGQGWGIFGVWDGTQEVRPDAVKYTEQEAKKMQDYPLLAKKGCRYNKEMHQIEGNIENLLKEWEPIW